ncbi:hypothetical protein ACFL2U_03100 [Patescibacteria group bacterium]
MSNNIRSAFGGKKLIPIFLLISLVIILTGCRKVINPPIQSQIESPSNQAVDTDDQPIIVDDNWVERRQAVDPDFNLVDFELVEKSFFELGAKRPYVKKLSALEKRFYAFAPDQVRYLDVYGEIDVFEYEGELRYERSTVEMGPNIPPDFPDPNYREPAIVDLTDNTAQTIPDVSYSSVRNSFWISDQEFVLTGYRIVEKGLIPYLHYFNLQAGASVYYEGVLQRFCENVGNCPEDMMTLKVYITGCPSRETKVYERQVKKTKEVAKAALNQLLIGPFAAEIDSGQQYLFHVQGPNYPTVKEIKIIDNIAYVNLNDIRSIFVSAGEDRALRNCQEYAFFEQASKTLKQFLNIKDAVYFIEGKTNLFYDYLGIACPDDLCENNPFKSEMQETYVYYNSCNEPVRQYLRLIPKSEDKIEATLKEEFKGPYDYESYYGVGGILARYANIELLGLEIKDSIAYVNINDYTNGKYELDHHCHKAQFFASVGAAITQFPEIKDAIYYFDGNNKKFYDYMGVDCPYEKECQYNPFK